MTLHITDFSAHEETISGLLVVTMKQITDERGTIRELFRRSAFRSIGVELAPFEQINVTETARGAIRGLHAEAMVKLVTVSAGRALGAYVDLRPASPTFGVVATVELSPGTQVLVPVGVANGFQALDDRTQYVYCFDREWEPGMPGRSCNPLDPDLAIVWPLTIDIDDPAMISTKDRDARSFGSIREELTS